MMIWQRVIVTAGHLWMIERCQLPPEPLQCFPPAVYPNLQSPPFPGGKCMHLLPGSGFSGVKNMGREKELIAQVHAYSPFSLFVKWLLILPNTGMFACLFVFKHLHFLWALVQLAVRQILWANSHSRPDISTQDHCVVFSLPLPPTYMPVFTNEGPKSTPVSPSVSLHLSSWDRFSY